MRTEGPLSVFLRRCAGAVALAAAVLPSEARAQLLSSCTGEVATAELISACTNAVAGLEGVRDGLAVGHAGASPVSGTASALGRRFGATPRFAVAGRIGMVRFDRADPDSWVTTGRVSGWTPVFGATVAAGILDGFSIAPTAGGFLALDLIGDVSTLRLPSGDGFEEASVAWGYGVRVGLLRESFTLPGVSVSVMRREGAEIVLEGDDGSADADVTTTSIRATLGKELLGFGFHGGAGWDQTSAEGTLEVTPNGAPGPRLEFADESDTRFVVFGGFTRTFLVTTVGADFGWSDRVAFGSITLRLTI